MSSVVYLSVSIEKQPITTQQSYFRNVSIDSITRVNQSWIHTLSSEEVDLLRVLSSSSVKPYPMLSTGTLAWGSRYSSSPSLNSAISSSPNKAPPDPLTGDPDNSAKGCVALAALSRRAPSRTTSLGSGGVTTACFRYLAAERKWIV